MKPKSELANMNVGGNRIPKAAVLGLGLIGGSIGLALLQENLACEVTGYDRSREAIEKALELGAINYPAATAADAVQDAEIVFLAVPVGSISSLAGDIAPVLKKGAIVTDTGSVKEPVVRALENIFKKRALYVGGHPMAGSEQAGIGSADRYLIENAVYVLTRTPNTDNQAVGILSGLLEKMGAKVLILSPEEHDLLVAGVSHLPHLLAVSLMQTVGELAGKHPLALTLAAGGFRDTTRIAGGEPVMWRDIFLYNGPAIRKILASWRFHIDALEKMIAGYEQKKIEEYLVQARELRNQLPARKKGLLPSLHELVVNVPDSPGIIGKLATLLGEAGVNITDIEILRVREGVEGNIRLGFNSFVSAQKAMEVLKNTGITVRLL